MEYLTELEFYEKNWTEDKKQEMKIAIQKGIERDDQYSNWYKTLTPLKLYLCQTGLQVPTLKGCQEDFSSVEKKEVFWQGEVVFLPTSKEFYPNFYCEGVAYCKASLRQNKETNLELWTIRLGGDDDYSISFDIIGEEEARQEWGNLFNHEFITDNTTDKFYFSN